MNGLIHEDQVAPPSELYSGFSMLAGTTSETETDCASEVPLFVVVIVNVSNWPAFTGLGELVLVTNRSAEAVTGLLTVDVLLVRSASGVELATIAVLEMFPVALLFTKPRISMLNVLPGIRLPSV